MTLGGPLGRRTSEPNAAATTTVATAASDHASGVEGVEPLRLVPSTNGAALAQANLGTGALIDWSGGLTPAGRPAPSVALLVRAASQWVRDFVTDLGREDSRLGPNAEISVTIPVTVDLQPGNGTTKH